MLSDQRLIVVCWLRLVLFGFIRLFRVRVGQGLVRAGYGLLWLVRASYGLSWLVRDGYGWLWLVMLVLLAARDSE